MPFDGSPSLSKSNQIVVDALRQGRARVARGWCQGQLCRVDGAVCAIGALTEGVLDPLNAPGMRQLLAASGCPYPAALARWNDTFNRQQSEVIALYDRAIAAAIAAEAR